MLLTYIYIYIYIDIITDVPDTSGESKNNIGPPEGGPKIEEHGIEDRAAAGKRALGSWLERCRREVTVGEVGVSTYI